MSSKGSAVGAVLNFDSSTQACLDASQYAGVTFTIFGKIGACDLTFGVASADNTAPTSGDPRPTCTASACNPPRVPVLGSGVHTVSFASLLAAGNGMPAGALDLRKVVALEWQVTAPPGTTCSSGFTISDLAFTLGGGGDVNGQPSGCSTGPAAQPTELIADFTGSQGIEIGGSVASYPSDGTGPTFDLSGGGLHFQVTRPPTSAPQNLGVGISFPDCIDASTSTGIQFSILGSFSGCTLQYSTAFAQDDQLALDVNKGACTGPVAADCYAPSFPIATISSTAAMTVQVPFYGPGLVGGAPLTVIDPRSLTSLQWQLDVPAGSGPSCTADIHIDDVTFY
jgi:hypothetical protein